MAKKTLVATITHQCKQYCEEEFFENLKLIKYDADILVVDNSDDGNYCKHLQKKFNIDVKHLTIKPHKKLPIQHKIKVSYNYVRWYFLKNNYDLLVLIESDVIPPQSTIPKFQIVSEFYNIISGLYYAGIHDRYKGLKDIYELDNSKDIVLSGCCAMNRIIMEKFKFRLEYENNNGNFPDAYLNLDTNNFRKCFITSIACEHRHDKFRQRGWQYIDKKTGKMKPQIKKKRK
jgi:cellulose synthase/poly-beta-1,6-N-acetylglucosamine synthase-like glycosyltransferase